MSEGVGEFHRGPGEKQPLFFITVHSGWIVEAPVNPFCITWKDRTLFVRVVANCNHVIEFLIDEFIYRFRPMSRDVDPNLAHRLNRLGFDGSRIDAGAFDFKAITGHHGAITLRAFGCGLSCRYKESTHACDRSSSLPRVEPLRNLPSLEAMEPASEITPWRRMRLQTAPQ